MKNTRRLICATLLMSLAPAIAMATPGQTEAQFLTWAKASPGLHDMQKKVNEMSALPNYSATIKAGSVAGTFLATVGEHAKIVDESVAVANGGDSYDILKHPDTSWALLSAVYGTAIAGDFQTAAKVGAWTLFQQTQKTTLYRGKLFGYEAAYAWVKLIPLSQVDAEAKLLATCAKEECGD